jgi:hypothetical protein
MAAAAPIGSVSVGQYQLQVGGAGGTLVVPLRGRAEGDPAELASALGDEPRTSGESAEDIVDGAAEVTTRIEQAVALLKDLAAGGPVAADVPKRVDLLLETLERLDKENRWEEARRLARALNGVLALLFRWGDLVRSLKLIHEAAERVKDMGTLAWSEHELGTLHLVAGDRAGANRRLEEAHRIRREIRDEVGLAATEHNLHVLCQELRAELPDEDGQRSRARRLVLPVAVAILLLAIGGVAGAALDPEPDPDEGGDGDPVARDGEDAQLAVRTEGAGSVTSTPAGIQCPGRCERRFARGTGIVLAAQPSGDATFAGWSGGGCRGTVRCELRLGRDTTVTASFKGTEPSTAILRIRPPSDGAVTSEPRGIVCPQTCERAFRSGEEVALIATAAEGFVFGRWGGDCTGTEGCSVTMTADRTVSASFVPAPSADVTVTVTGDGTVTSDVGGINCGGACTASVEPGEQILLTATAGLLEWGGACSGTGATCTLTPEADTAVTAAFSDVD